MACQRCGVRHRIWWEQDRVQDRVLFLTDGVRLLIDSALFRDCSLFLIDRALRIIDCVHWLG